MHSLHSSSSSSNNNETAIELTDADVVVIREANGQSDAHEPEYFVEEEDEPNEHEHDIFDIQYLLSKFHVSPKKLLHDNYGIIIMSFSFFIILLLLGTLASWDFGWKGWMVWALIWLMALLLGKDLLEADAVFTLIMTLLLGMMIIDVPSALSGFSNEGVASVVILFVVAKGVQNTGGLDYLLKRVLGTPKNIIEAQARLVFPVTIISAFLHNTPLVAMMMPVVETWSRRMGVSSSRFMMPLSYAAILGGTCTILGTSNNLIVLGLWQAKEPDFDVSIWEMGKIGWPLAVIGAIYVMIAPKWLLQERVSPQAQYKKNPREYCVAVSVKPTSSLSGKTIEEAHLRGLKGLFLVEIQRSGETIEAPSADTKLQANDVLIFSGMVSSVQELFHMDGLAAISDQAEKLKGIADRKLYEVVISSNSSMVGLAVKKAKFRTKYGAAIIAVHRFGERVRSKIGDIVIQPGDTFLIESKANFYELHSESENFALVAEVADYKPIVKDKKRMWYALFLMAGMIVVTSGEWMDILACCMCVSLLMILGRCMTLDQAKKSIKMKVVIAIATVFGLGAAVSNTGIALQVANSIVDLVDSGGSIGLLFGLYIATVLMCQLISNHAALVVMFPIAYEFYTKGLLTRKAVLYTLMFAGSADFSTPFGYQTNLMVTGAAGYHFVDFVKMGVPLQVICCLVSVFLTYFFFQA